jgi:hypothetical protein
MNEIIAKLYDQAKDHADYYAMLSDEPEQEIFTKKFAELIVRECLSQVEKQYKPMLEDETMMKDKHWAGYVECGIDSCAAIKEHFGVSDE